MSLATRCFSILDLTTDTYIPQSSIRVQRPAFSRAKGSGDNHLFLTLYLNTPVVISTPFGPSGGNSRPEPKAVVERGWVLDSEGNETKTRRSRQGCGVDGLEGSYRYRVDVARGPLMGVQWWWGTKEELLVEPGRVDWNLLPGEDMPLTLDLLRGWSSM
jgi:hypothetical protein